MSTYTSLTYHIVFSTKYRKRIIAPTLRPDLYEYIGGIIRGEKGRLIEIGGIEDHVHILAGFSPAIAVSDMLRHIKGGSSKWVNEREAFAGRFAWQQGYAAFTVSQSQMLAVQQYIQRQEEHHKRLTFKEEYLAILKRHQINFDMKFVFEQEHLG